jgi:hypothetical protein
MEKSKIAAIQKEPKFDFRTIKTFEQACHKIRVTTSLPELTNGCGELLKPTIAAYKLMVIFQAINDGWIPDWDNTNQSKYYPWFRVLSSGFSFSNSTYACASATTTAGSRLCTNTPEKALYIGAQFEQEYKDLLLLK